jgi:hypothetical protein
MNRREFIAGLGSAAAWPPAVQAQRDRVRRIGVPTPVKRPASNSAYLRASTRR